MQKARITLSFDDGRKDTYYVFKEILFKNNIAATLNVPIGYIECGYNDYRDIGYNGLMTREELDEIAESDLVEIANHSFWHNNEIDDIEKGMKELKKLYPDKKIVGYASPHSEINEKIVLRNKADYEHLGISYVRVGRNFGRYNIFMRFFSFMAKKTKTNIFFKWCYCNSLNSKKTYVLHSVPIMRDTTLEQIKTIIQHAIKNKAWIVLAIHGLDSVKSQEYQEIFCWDIELFRKLCNYLLELQDKGLINIENANNVYSEVE